MSIVETSTVAGWLQSQPTVFKARQRQKKVTISGDFLPAGLSRPTSTSSSHTFLRAVDTGRLRPDQPLVGDDPR
jgi:hypothetical protein